MTGISVCIGLMVGSMYILPLILKIQNHFIHQNNASAVLKPYEDSSVNLTIIIPPRVPANVSESLASYDQYPAAKHRLIKLRYASNGYGRSASKSTDMEYHDFYDGAHQKYFSIIMFDLAYPNLMRMNAYNFWLMLGGKKVNIRINKKDLANPDYGTRAKPIPVFKVWGADSALQGRGIYHILKTGQTTSGIFNYDITDEQYHRNVYLYFTYELTDKEFENRFRTKTVK